MATVNLNEVYIVELYFVYFVYKCDSGVNVTKWAVCISNNAGDKRLDLKAYKLIWQIRERCDFSC